MKRLYATALLLQTLLFWVACGGISTRQVVEDAAVRDAGGASASGGAGAAGGASASGGAGAAGGASAAGGTGAAGGAAGSGTTGHSCLNNSACDPTLQFCLKTSCDAAATGFCATRPGTRETGFCSPSGDLVCGCDGETYPYDCIANAAGVNVASTGACPLPDGGGLCSSNGDCGDSKLYCNKATCIGSGTCEPMPDLLSCLADGGAGGAVCGCDHQGYSNGCEAASYGTSVDYPGACALPDGPCASQADCGGESYASVVFCRPTGCDFATGHCTVLPGGCPELLDPVCGCDGVMYPNDCYSDFQGIGAAYPGPCRDGAIVSCDTSEDCADGDCIDDPRPGCAFGGCAGVCLTSVFSCGPNANNGEISCFDGACVRTRNDCSGNNQPCGACAFGTRVECDAEHPCVGPELCVPEYSCGGRSPCPSVCIRP